jgi:hypothetical protein
MEKRIPGVILMVCWLRSNISQLIKGDGLVMERTTAVTEPDTCGIETGQFNGWILYIELIYNCLYSGIFLAR